MAIRSVPQSSPSSPPGGTPPTPPGVFLSLEEWQEVSDCTSALFAALKCFERQGDEAWELVISVQQRFQRALAPINERLSDEMHGNSH